LTDRSPRRTSLAGLVAAIVCLSLALAVLNEAVWRTQSEEFWVGFKVYGITALNLVFIVGQVFYMFRFMNHAGETVRKLAEEHTIVDVEAPKVNLGDRRQVIPAHCCATMNLHRQCLAVRNGKVEAVWPIEASGRFY